MKLSVKARYGLAAVVTIARRAGARGECVTLISLSEKLDISKIYLEQVFSLLKRGGVVTATKGALGGYQLSRPPEEISALDVLASIEFSLFEPTEPTVSESSAPLERAMQEAVFEPLDAAAHAALADVSIAALAARADALGDKDSYMFYL